MKTAILGTLAFAAVLFLPALTHAALYQYVNTSGYVETVNADNARDALVTASDRDPHSGVMLLNPVTVSVNSGVAGTYTEQMTSGNTAGESLALVLAPDGTAALATNYENSDTPTVQNGSWVMTGTNQVQLTLTGTASQTYSPVQTIVFTENGNVLNGTQYTNTSYGTPGLSLTEQSY